MTTTPKILTRTLEPESYMTGTVQSYKFLPGTVSLPCLIVDIVAGSIVVCLEVTETDFISEILDSYHYSRSLTFQILRADYIISIQDLLI